MSDLQGKSEPRITDKQKMGAGILAAGVAAATLLIMPFEGKRNDVYLDPSHIPTGCYGRIKGMKMGDHYTDGQCKAFLTEDVAEHAAPLVKCLPATVTPNVFGAMLSFGYNAGPGTVCKNFAPLIAAGRTREACAKLSLYVYSRDRKTGKQIKYRGLERRRAAERALCEKGLR